MAIWVAATPFQAVSADQLSQGDALLSSWLAAQQTRQTWTADVTQTRTLKTLSQPLVSRGRVWFQAPRTFRWEIGEPATTIAIRQSDQMLVIYPKLKRAERYPMNDAQAGPWKETLALLEAGFSRNRADLESKFRVLTHETTDDICRVTMEAQSASARRLMPRIQIAFNVRDFSLAATELTFADGSTMRNEFSNSQTNPPLDAQLFEPELPADYKIVEPMKR